jgi:sec-independent protein translocase protein TatC
MPLSEGDKPRDPHVLLARIRSFRTGLIRVILVLAGGSVLGFMLTQQLLNLVTVGVDELIYLAPAEAFMVHLRLAFSFGVAVSLPFAIVYLALAAGRGLPWRRKLSLWLVLLLSLALFVTGIVFAYAVVLPTVLAFLLSFATEQIQPLFALEAYVAFVLGLVVPFGLVFQLPLTMAALARLGVVAPRTMASFRRMAILAIFVLSAVLTPPDLVSQLLMAGPMMVLYEMGLLLARVAWRSRGAAAGPVAGGGVG